MADIVLTTLNAKYIHAAFGLRYLLANLGVLQSRACLAEFDINQRPLDIAEILLARNPRIIGFGIYIWNVEPTAEVIATIRRVRPDIKIILGGPEVSYETENQAIVQLADHVITGEADLKFAEVCRVLLFQTTSRNTKEQIEIRRLLTPPRPSVGDGEEGGRRTGEEVQLPKIIPAELPEFSQLALPYDLYTDDDIAHRIIYVEASRGCPFTCEFCLSSLDIPVRQVPLPALLEQLQRLLDRGVKQFKFVDRTFNLNVNVSKTILEFFLERYQSGCFYHFEMIPDRLPESLREIIAKFAPGALQFEVGIQTFNEEVSAAIKRRQNYGKLADNFHFLRRKTGVHIHADLIAGLPGETLEGFGAGFDRLIALGPQEIQVGILKRLRGTPIVRHDAEWQMVYSPHPPYEILLNQLMDFTTMQKLRRFARYWDLVGNSGNFIETTPLIWGGHGVPPSGGPAGASADRQPPKAGTSNPSPFHAFLHFSEWLYGRTGRTDSIALTRLLELLFEFLTRELRLDTKQVAETLWRDYRRTGRRDKPVFLKDFLPMGDTTISLLKTKAALPKRQARHLAQIQVSWKSC
ncbi:MAG TPA: radical SAM protein [Verrucomicrobiae bacterium]|nr:radical SAM protein [Verrucomicrobiae bacterium]